MNSEKEDLEHLLTHPGWLRIVQAEQEWWSEQISSQLEICANDNDDTQALNKMRQIIAAKKAVERFIARPKEKLSKINAEQRVEAAKELGIYASRGGYRA